MPHANSDTVSYPAPEGDEPIIILREPGADLAPDGVVNSAFVEEIEAEATPENEERGVRPSPGNNSNPSSTFSDNSKTNSGKRTSAR